MKNTEIIPLIGSLVDGPQPRKESTNQVKVETSETVCQEKKSNKNTISNHLNREFKRGSINILGNLEGEERTE